MNWSYIVHGPDEKLVDIACLDCSLEVSVVVEKDLDEVSAMWQSCCDCGGFIVPLMDFKSKG